MVKRLGNKKGKETKVMWRMKDECIIRCGCGQVNHLFQLWFSREEEFPPELFITFSNDYGKGLIGRIKDSIRYISGKWNCLYKNEICLNLDNADERREIEDLIKYLEKTLKENKPKSPPMVRPIRKFK